MPGSACGLEEAAHVLGQEVMDVQEHAKLALLAAVEVVVVGDAFTNPADDIPLYEAEETTTAFETLGTSKSSIFRVKVRSMRSVMLMKPTKAISDFGNKRASGSGEDTHQLYLGGFE